MYPEESIFYAKAEKENERLLRSKAGWQELLRQDREGGPKQGAEAANREQSGYTFAEVSDTYWDYIGGRSSPIWRGTYNAYVKNLKKLDAEFGSWQMKEIDAQAVRSFWEHMKAQSYKLKTITNCRSVLSCVFAYWCTNMHGTGNPVALAGLELGLYLH